MSIVFQGDLNPISSKDFCYKASSQSDCSLCISNLNMHVVRNHSDFVQRWVSLVIEIAHNIRFNIQSPKTPCTFVSVLRQWQTKLWDCNMYAPPRHHQHVPSQYLARDTHVNWAKPSSTFMLCVSVQHERKPVHYTENHTWSEITKLGIAKSHGII